MTVPDPRGRGLSRRAWVTTATSGVIAAGLVRTQLDAVDLLGQQPPPRDPTKVMGRIVSEVGTRAPSEQPRRILRAREPSSSSRTPIADLHGVITPSDLHFERHHAG
ncbi:MAG TPA: sulfite dehydrogenase, partial [Candidatus Thermoplasmatota archaeon]